MMTVGSLRVDRVTELEVFSRAAELASLSKAAEALGMSTSAASRHLASLEARLDARLVHRTTRCLALTEAGERFVMMARELLGSLAEAESSIRDIVVKPTGNLRIGASLSFCLEHLEPILPRFTALYPELTIELVSANRYFDVLGSDVDVAIRTRRMEPESSIMIRRLAETRRLLAAAPAYLEQHGTPGDPMELERHKLLIYNLTERPNELRLRRGKEQRTVAVKGLLSANDSQIIRQAAVRGLGICALPAYVLDADLEAGRLVRILDDWDLPRLIINIAYADRSHLPTKVRLFIDFLANEFREKGYDARWTA